MKNDNPKFIIFAFLIVVFTFSFLIFNSFGRNKANPANALDAFAKCLSDKGAVMYGAEWCPYCKEEIKSFGKSFKFINYVECPQDPSRCIKAGIEAYPTWIFHSTSSGQVADGKKLVGMQGLEKLALESGCQIQQ